MRMDDNGRRRVALPVASWTAALALLAGTGSALAQEGENREFGTKDENVLTISAAEFEGFDQDTKFNFTTNGYRYGTVLNNGAARFALKLPTGASIVRIELEACDESTTEGVTADLFVCGPDAASGCTYRMPVSTGVPEANLCQRFVGTAVAPVQVDNRNFTYYAEIGDPDSSPLTRFRAVRFFWKRQVSPAPGQATFADVPTNHPFFRFVEALVASGITGGCAAGPPLQYCPDAPLTRGQMAVFLATALGLHWPN